MTNGTLLHYGHVIVMHLGMAGNAGTGNRGRFSTYALASRIFAGRIGDIQPGPIEQLG